MTRIDKWLWAARFFKTRSLAQKAIELGRVRLREERVNRSSTLEGENGGFFAVLGGRRLAKSRV